MKRFFATSVLILICGTFCFAQDYLVYTVKGDITVKKGTNNEKVTSGMTLSSDDVINIPTESRLVILNESSKELHTIKIPSNDILGSIIRNTDNSKQQLTDSYLAFIKQKVTGADSKKDKNHMQAAGTSYRDINDSTMLDILVPSDRNDK